MRLTRDQYQRVREEPTDFLTVDGHKDAEAAVAEVVSREQGYVVVRKDGDTLL